ncbi:MAG: DUF402 domain-containing protein [Lachnospiraceae bacterium]|jgi:protein associated with RNAse G/E|nr:DUF402 domain-containing protein [Lachnospiraceae bacterium]MCI8997152.1 DUF402 domain-containing protein [Lachnospiraceae bacterium]MCI9133029.1 DUF402 domain-containing protein [Lachnospiraceae bacterium]
MSHIPLLYRRRLIPEECILLKNDRILYQEEASQILITQWNTLRPKKDLDHGASCYLLNRGWKISKYLDSQDHLICWYCDIIDTFYDQEQNTYTFLDLLADVLIYPDGQVKVVDLDEVADALDTGLINVEQIKLCMRRLDGLLRMIYSGQLLSLPPLLKMEELLGSC